MTRAKTPSGELPTLAAQALQSEQVRHACRLASIKRMDARLRALDTFMPAVRAAGITVHGDEINCYGTAALSIFSATLNPQRNATLEKVLRAQGMEEVARRAYVDGSYSVELKKGRLTVRFCVEAHRLAKAQEAAKCA